VREARSGRDSRTLGRFFGTRFASNKTGRASRHEPVRPECWIAESYIDEDAPVLLSKTLAGAALGVLILALSLTQAPAQPPPPPQPASGQPPGADPNGDGIEVLARGPVHEAYAGTVEQPGPSDIVPKAPPEPIEELPPDQRPEGDNVQWIPGYWHWDLEREDFIWISGFWRIPPPGHIWVPGSWQEMAGSFQWVPGFWQEIVPQQPVQPEITYLPPPPQTIEVGPTVPPPNETSIYVPGSWIWRDRYVWRPGFWIPFQPGWVWVPAHYRWTPIGFVFIDGYWDYPLDTRGVLFSPVYLQPRAFAQPGFAFTPRYMIARQLLLGALFSRRGYSNYYFGDYYDPLYAKRGFYPWSTSLIRDNVDLGLGRRFFYDPMWSYYSVANRNNPLWARNVGDLYIGRYRGDIPRPPRTLAQQNQVIRKLTNVTDVTNITNNITVVNDDLRVGNKDVTPVVMIAPLQVAPKLQPAARIQPITQQVQVQEAKVAQQFRQTAIDRRKAEAAVLKQRPPAKADTTIPGQPPRPQAVVQPTRLKIDLPKTAVESARIQPKEKAPPPPVQPKVDLKAQPKLPKGIEPKVEPKQPKVIEAKVEPKVPMPKSKQPKIEPKQPAPGLEPKQPLLEPKGKVEPKQPIPAPKGKAAPKQPFPKGEPKQPKGPEPETQPGLRVPQPKVEPQPPVPRPQVDPKQPFPRPKAEPKQPLPKVEPRQPMPLPKVEPKQPLPKFEPKQPLPNVEPKQPLPMPKVEPKPFPQPKVEPKQPFPKEPKGPPRAEPKGQPKQPRVEPPPPPPRIEPNLPPPPPRVEPKGGPPQQPKGKPKGKGKGKGKSEPPEKDRS
jgi:hypothetical protein